MNERAQGPDDDTMRCGLLMESAQAHQKLAEVHLEKLRAHTQDLDAVVRDEIRRTLVSELQMLTLESRRAAEAFRRIKHGARLHSGLMVMVLAVLCTSIPIAIVHCVLPSESEIASLRARRDELTSSLAALEKRGGRIDWRRCGETRRLCVRVDRKAPTYGEKADYYVVGGD